MAMLSVVIIYVIAASLGGSMAEVY